MTVYELMNILKNAPAGMKIRVHSDIDDHPSGDLLSADYEGLTVDDGFVNLNFSTDPEEE